LFEHNFEVKNFLIISIFCWF